MSRSLANLPFDNQDFYKVTSDCVVGRGRRRPPPPKKVMLTPP
ncbi:MAG: hypothetical protein AAFU79_14965 [Myxococcota bacterium]